MASRCPPISLDLVHAIIPPPDSTFKYPMPPVTQHDFDAEAEGEEGDEDEDGEEEEAGEAGEEGDEFDDGESQPDD